MLIDGTICRRFWRIRPLHPSVRSWLGKRPFLPEHPLLLSLQRVGDGIQRRTRPCYLSGCNHTQDECRPKAKVRSSVACI